MSATSEGTMTAADAPASACAAITHPTAGASSMSRLETANVPTTTRKARTQPRRCPTFAPVITRAATDRP